MDGALAKKQEYTTPIPLGTAGAHTLIALDERYIPAMLALQEAGGDGQIVERDYNTLRAHFQAGHSAIGVYDGHKLLAQALIRTDTLSDTFKKQTTMGGVVVAPEARGQGLMDLMVATWLRRATRDGIDTAHARVRVGNEKSWAGFMRHALAITAVGASPDHPHEQVYFMHRPLQTFRVVSHANPCGADRGDIGSRLADGQIATGWNPKLRHFTMAGLDSPLPRKQYRTGGPGL